MPKRLIIHLDVPSGSRVKPMFNWLTKLLADHRMSVVSVEDPATTEKEEKPNDPVQN